MKRHTLFSAVTRLALSAACVISSVSCGGELLRTGRSPVYLVIQDITTPGGSVLRSDVVNATGIALDDLGTATIAAEAKNRSVATTPINAVTLTRYHVAYRRADGRNSPGVDVPFAFDGGLNVTIQPGRSSPVTFQLVRQQSKLEAPLRNLVGGGGVIVISTIADITFYGRDQNGNEVVVSGNMDVQFGDF